MVEFKCREKGCCGTLDLYLNIDNGHTEWLCNKCKIIYLSYQPSWESLAFPHEPTLSLTRHGKLGFMNTNVWKKVSVKRLKRTYS